MYFKEEILGNLKRLDVRLNDRIDQQSKTIDSKISPISLKFDELSNKVFDLSSMISQDKLSLEKISQLLQFKAKVEDTLQSHLSQIRENSKDISNACYKYDKMMFENFMVPGLIGNNCKYPTMKSYIESNTAQVTALNSFKDKNQIDLKAYKDKLERLVEQFHSQIENVKSSFLDYCRTSFEEMNIKFNERCKETEDRIEIMRIENGKYSLELKQLCENLGIEWERILKMKKEIYTRFECEVENFQNIHNDTVESMEEYKKEFKLIKKKFTELSEFIKDVRFRKNLGGDVVKKKEIKDISDKINFNKKQKYESSSDNDGDENETENKKSVGNNSSVISDNLNIKKRNNTKTFSGLSPSRKKNEQEIQLKQTTQTQIPINTLTLTTGNINNNDNNKIDTNVKPIITHHHHIHSSTLTQETDLNNKPPQLNNNNNNSLRLQSLREHEINLKHKQIPKPDTLVNKKEQDNNNNDNTHIPLIKNKHISSKKVTLTPIETIQSPIINPVATATATTNTNATTEQNNYTQIDQHKINLSTTKSLKMLRQTIMDKLLTSENKINTLEKSTNRKFIELANLINNLILQIKIQNQKANRQYVNDIKLNVVSSGTVSHVKHNSNNTSPINDHMNQGLLSSRNPNHLRPKTDKEHVMKIGENKIMFNKRKKNLNLKGSDLGLLDNNQQMLTTYSNMFIPGNKFSPLSLVITNEPKSVPNDGANMLLREIEPYLIKMFDEEDTNFQY